MPKAGTFSKFDSKNFENIYTYEPEKKFHIIEKSINGEKVLFDQSRFISYSKNNIKVLNEEGKAKSFEGKDWLPKDFEAIEEFITKDLFVVLGYENNKKNFIAKRVKEYKLFTRNLNTFEAKYTNLKLPPNLGSDKNIIKFNLINNYSENGFYLLTKDVVNEYMSSQSYRISKYNLEGTVLNEFNLQTNIDGGFGGYFKHANTGSNSYKRIVKSYLKADGSTRTSVYYLPKASAWGNVYIDEDNKEIYTYSIIGSPKSVNGSGFLINKFDYDGNLIWKKEKMVFDKKNHLDIDDHDTDVRFFNTSKNIGFSISNNRANYIKTFEIDKKSGNILNTTEHDKMKEFNPGGSFVTVVTSNFQSSLLFKKGSFPKNFVLDINTVTAYDLNSEFKAYVDSLPLVNNKLHFKTRFTRDGFVSVNGNNKTREYEFTRFKF